jgi:hypothetical protein
MQYKAHIQRLQSNYPDFDVDTLERRVAGAIRSALRKGWWAGGPQAVITGEGGYDSMVFNALIEVCAAGGDTHKGVKNYLKHLAFTYANDRAENKHGPLDEAEDNNYLQTEGDPASESLALVAAAPSAALHQELIALSRSSAAIARTVPQFSPQEQDFLDTYAHVGSVKEAAELAGLSPRRARSVLFNVRKWVRRRMAS